MFHKWSISVIQFNHIGSSTFARFAVSVSQQHST